MAVSNKVVNREYLLTQFKNYNKVLVNTKVAAINATLDTKVDKRVGYALSKNDFTDAFKEKLEGLENYDDTDVKDLIKTNTDAIALLNDTSKGEDGNFKAGSVAATVETRVQEIIDNADEDFDTLKEISEWIGTHTQEATTMNGNISANASAIQALQEAQNNMEYEYETENIDFGTLEASTPVQEPNE